MIRWKWESKLEYRLGGFEYNHADDVIANAGSGGATFRTDQLAGLQHVPYTKLMSGTADDAAVIPGDATNGLFVQVKTSAAIPVTDNAGSLTVDSGQLPAALGQSTMANSMTVALASNQSSIPVAATLTAETTKVIGTINIAAAQTIAATNAGTFVVQENGAALTSLQLIDDVIIADDAAFTPATTRVAMVGFTFDDVTPDSVNEGDAGAARMSANRNIYTTLRDAAGNERGVNVSAGNALLVDASATTQPVSLASVPSHAVTNAGTFATQATLQTGSNTIGALTANQSVNVAQINGVTALMGNGVTGTGSQRVTIASDNTAFSVNATLQASTGTQEVVGDVAHDAVAAGNPVLQGGYASAAAPTDVSADADAVRAWHLRNGAAATVITAAGALVGGDAANGLDVDVTRVPTDPFGANADAASATGSISAKLRFIAATGIPVTGTATVGSHAVTNAGTFAVQAGQAAHDAAITGSPVRIAGRAGTADYTAVADGDTSDLLTTILGKLVVQDCALPANTWNYAAAAGGLVNTTEVTAKAAAGAGIRNYVTKAQITNSHQTIGTEVVIRDGTAGTVLFRAWAQFTGGGVECEFKPPLRGTANTLISIGEVTATGTAGVLVNLQGYVGAE